MAEPPGLGPEVSLLKASAEVLQMPHKALATALIFMHRFQSRAQDLLDNPSCQALHGDPYRLVCACLFVAAKASEVVLTSSDLINIVRCLMRPKSLALATSCIPGLVQTNSKSDVSTADPDAGALSGDDYYTAKTFLLHDEQVLLRTLQFRVSEELPHSVLLNLCRCLECPRGVAQLGICILNDALMRTNLAGSCAPELLAAASLRLAGLFTACPALSEEREENRGAWWTGVGVAFEDIESTGHALLDIIEGVERGKE